LQHRRGFTRGETFSDATPAVGLSRVDIDMEIKPMAGKFVARNLADARVVEAP